jgi:hypothetical protein
MAIDGSFSQLLSDPELLKHYGGWGLNRPRRCWASMRYDLENDSIVDAKLALVSGNERALAEEHLEALRGLKSFEAEHELIIVNRGYPSHDFINPLQGKELAYVMCIQKGCARRGVWEPAGRLGNVREERGAANADNKPRGRGA